MEPFEVIDVSGDIGIRACGQTLKEAFANAAIGLYGLSVDIERIEEKRAVNISTDGHTVEGLLVSWLNELIFHLDAHGFIGKKVSINEFSCKDGHPESSGDCGLKAVIYGEDFDPERHQGKLLIKAATYHALKIEKKNDYWEIDVIFDI